MVKQKARKKMEKQTTKKAERVMEQGSVVWLIRQRYALDPVPEDVEDNPADVVRATMVGHDTKRKMYLFDDGRMASVGPLLVKDDVGELGKTVFWSEKEAKDALTAQLFEHQLPYDRYRYLKAQDLVELFEEKEERLQNMSGSTIRLVARLTGIKDREQITKMTPEERTKRVAAAKAFMAKITKRWGADTLWPSEDFEEATAPAEKPAPKPKKVVKKKVKVATSK